MRTNNRRRAANHPGLNALTRREDVQSGINHRTTRLPDGNIDECIFLACAFLQHDAHSWGKERAMPRNQPRHPRSSSLTFGARQNHSRGFARLAKPNAPGTQLNSPVAQYCVCASAHSSFIPRRACLRGAPRRFQLLRPQAGYRRNERCTSRVRCGISPARDPCNCHCCDDGWRQSMLTPPDRKSWITSNPIQNGWHLHV